MSPFSIQPLIADFVWPALVLEQRILSIVPILTGLFLEWLALWFGGFGLSWKRAALADCVMNAASMAAGTILIPLLGFLWEVFPGSVLYKAFRIGTFNPGTWLATFGMAVLATTAVEAAVLKLGFRLALGTRRLMILTLANVVSVGIAFVSLWIHPPRW